MIRRCRHHSYARAPPSSSQGLFPQPATVYHYTVVEGGKGALVSGRRVTTTRESVGRYKNSNDNKEWHGDAIRAYTPTSSMCLFQGFLGFVYHTVLSSVYEERGGGSGGAAGAASQISEVSYL